MKQGVVMEIQAKNAYVFTNECDLVKMPVNSDMFVGQSIVLPEPKAQSAMPRRWLVPVLAAACIVLLISTGLLFSALLMPRAATAYLSLDINPSIEFELDDQRKVVAVTPLNADAWELLQETQLIGLHYEEAIVKWIEALRVSRPEQFEDLLISAVLDKRDRELIDQIMALNGQKAAEKLAELAGLNVRVLFSTDRAVKEQADANKLSIGRQMLLNLALEKKLDLTSDSIRKGALSDLLNKIMPDETTETIAETTIQETAAETTVDTAETTVLTETSPETTAETTKETIRETTKETSKETSKETTKATTAVGFQLEAVSSGSGWTLTWTMSPSGKELSYYKVTVSQSDSTPEYPDNGYLYALSRESNSCLVNNSQAYNGGDFNGYLTVGQKYYVCITYVFKDGSKQYSNVRQLTYSGPARVEPAPFNPDLQAVSNAEGLKLNWTVSPDDRTLKYYKVVISKNDSTPQYSENGYLYALSKYENSCIANNSSKYNGTTDFGYYLTPGQEYYVAVTYVFAENKITSNVLLLTYNGPAAITEMTATAADSSFDKILTGGNDTAGLHLSWSQGPADESLLGYKVVVSKGDSSPLYDENGYLAWITDLGITDWTVDNSTAYNGTTDFGSYLSVNDWYYVSITYVMSNGDRLPSNVLYLQYTGPAAPAG